MGIFLGAMPPLCLSCYLNPSPKNERLTPKPPSGLGRQGPNSQLSVGSLAMFPSFLVLRYNAQGRFSLGDHLQKNISSVYNNLDVSFDSFPSDTTSRDSDSYQTAIDALAPADAVTIFTPDTTHYPIALYAIRRGIHVLITKPAVKLLEEHLNLLRESRKHNVFVFIEHHKRFDPAYADARVRAKSLGEFNYFYSYMSQPKSQLETFKAWAGKDSDISYYLNSHHVDICESMVPDYKPVKVTANASKGTAEDVGCVAGTEDTITLLVEWVRRDDPGRTATGVYTASWTAPQRAGVHSNQYFHCKPTPVYTENITDSCLETWARKARSASIKPNAATMLPLRPRVK